eukprot:TRINITY_DN16132_c0_g1_i1.p1 TRINITY_DN16132_c0_g1~~TRINITY_DN16132_c0_g1_i1.p1  ORF type:complete len:140 (-),score=21.39 TRINITY_DN16132_c0_g1_i1:142-561(-)
MKYGLQMVGLISNPSLKSRCDRSARNESAPRQTSHNTFFGKERNPLMPVHDRWNLSPQNEHFTRGSFFFTFPQKQGCSESKNFFLASKTCLCLKDASSNELPTQRILHFPHATSVKWARTKTATKTILHIFDQFGADDA